MLKWTVRAVPTATDDVSALFAAVPSILPVKHTNFAYSRHYCALFSGAVMPFCIFVGF
ncbi:MAG: hypothetical protein PT943_05555 [Ruminococcus sp.]|nr:hypothetical protein [Ruminococcus sp.]MDD6300680.1 hypothetical protein [Ruminococcus sp.]MDD7670702.1 hypothetical protein [Ruminococcus sp.]MDY2743358.1 hypothetical protein [Eubacteriales bacterium]